MKKILIFIIGMLIISCSKDDSQGSQTISSTNLVSITKKYYLNNSFTASEKLHFYDDKLIHIQYHDGSYEDYQYDNNLVSRILEFKSDHSLFWTITYLYDNFGRIIEIKRIPSSTNVEIKTVAKFSFVYNTNQILINSVFTPGGNETYELNLDSNNKILNEKIISINGNLVTFPFYAYTYVNGNLLNCLSTNQTIPENINYSYNTYKNDFNYNKYLFGKNWKLNNCLDYYVRGRNVKLVLETTSEYLVSSATHNFNNGSEITTYNYLFDDKNRIKKEIVNKTSTFFPPFKDESIYEYK